MKKWKGKMMLIMIIDCENAVLLSMLEPFCLDGDAMKMGEKILLILWAMMGMIDFH